MHLIHYNSIIQRLVEVLRWVYIFVARIIASCRSRVEIILTFQRSQLSNCHLKSYKNIIKITRQHELKTIVATRQIKQRFRNSIASPSQQFYCSSHRCRTRSINPPLHCLVMRMQGYILNMYLSVRKWYIYLFYVFNLTAI